MIVFGIKWKMDDVITSFIGDELIFLSNNLIIGYKICLIVFNRR